MPDTRLLLYAQPARVALPAKSVASRAKSVTWLAKSVAFLAKSVASRAKSVTLGPSFLQKLSSEAYLFLKDVEYLQSLSKGLQTL